MQEWKKFFEAENWKNPYWVALILASLLSLISMATMTVGFVLILVVGGFALFTSETRSKIWKFAPLKSYCGVAALMAVFLTLSVARQIYFPYEIFGKIPEASFRDSLKLIYLVEPIFLLAIFSKLSKKKIFQVVYFHWFILSLLGVISIIQYHTGWPRSVEIAYEDHEIRYAAVLFMGLSLSVSSLMILAGFPVFSKALTKITRNFDLQKNLPLFVAFILILLCVLLTFSRIAILSIPIGIALLLLVQKKLKWTHALLLSCVLGFGLYQIPSVSKRLHYQSGYSDRLAIWKGHIELIREFPWLGVGWRQNSKVLDGAVESHYKKSGEKIPEEYFQTHAHNNFLEILSGSGIIGLLFFSGFNLWILLFLFRRLKKNTDHWWFQGMLVGFLIFHLNGITQANFWDSKVFLQLMWLIGISLALAEKGNELESSSA